MLMEVRNQIKITLITIKYALIKEMLNKVTFIMNIVFMILNNACFIVQWVIIYNLKKDVGGYTFKQILLLWALVASTYGFSHFFFSKSYSLSDVITNGKLDAYLVQPKNVLISAITSDVDTSALGDMIYGYLLLIIYGFSFKNFALFTIFTIIGGIVLTDLSTILASLTFWFNKADFIADTGNRLMTNFATYPDGIFKGFAKILLFTIVPVGIINYIPLWVITKFNIELMLLTIVICIILTILTFIIFNSGLRKYSSTNLMVAKL